MKKDQISIHLNNEHNILIGEEYTKTREYIEQHISTKVKKNRNFSYKFLSIFDYIFIKMELYQAIRLMVLLSITNGGIIKADYDSLTQKFLHVIISTINVLLSLKQNVHAVNVC